MLYINTVTLQYPVYESEIRNKVYPQALPESLTEHFLASVGYAKVVESTTQIVKNPWDLVQEGAPVKEGNIYRQKWEVVPLTLEQKKARMLAHFNEMFNSLISQVKLTYPPTEVESWDKQEKEAREFLLDNTTPALIVRAIASARGIGVEDLAERIVFKADAYAAYVGNLIGIRQSLEDRIELATEETIDSIIWPPEDKEDI